MKTDLSFVNYTMSLERALANINRKIKDSQQREELTDQEIALLEIVHEKFFLPGVVAFDAKNINANALRVPKLGR